MPDKKEQTLAEFFKEQFEKNKSPKQKLGELKDRLTYETAVGQELTPADSSTAYRLGILKNSNNQSGSAKERAASRMAAGKYDNPFLASADSLTLGLKKNKQGELAERVKKMKYAEEIAELNARRKYQKHGESALTDEEKRILKLNKKLDQPSNIKKMQEYLTRGSQAGRMATATDFNTGAQLYSPQMREQAIQTESAMADSVALTNIATQWGVNVDELRNSYMNAKFEIERVLSSTPVLDPDERKYMAEQIAKKYGLDINAIRTIDNEFGK